MKGPLDDDVGKGAEATGGESGTELDTGVAPGLGVLESLDGLLLLEGPVLDTGLVVSHTLNHQTLILFTEALGSHGRIRHPPADKDTKNERNNGVRQEEPLPVLEGTRADEREAVRQETADDLLGTVHHVPVRHAGGLLFTAVPHSREDDKGGLAGGLEDTEEGADGDEAGHVGRGGVAAEDDGPGDDAEGEVLGYGDSGDDVVLAVVSECSGDWAEVLTWGYSTKRIPMYTQVVSQGQLGPGFLVIVRREDIGLIMFTYPSGRAIPTSAGMFMMELSTSQPRITHTWMQQHTQTTKSPYRWPAKSTS